MARYTVHGLAGLAKRLWVGTDTNLVASFWGEKKKICWGKLSILNSFFTVARETESLVPYGFTFSP